MEAAVAALEAAPKMTAGEASAAATEAAGAATPAMAAMATAEQAAASEEAPMAAEAATEESPAASAKEVAVDMRYSNKRKFHQIDDDGRGGGSRDDGGSLDLISALPDELIGNIISFLPTKDGARTQAISRRWLPLWRSAPLNLVAEFDPAKSRRTNHKLIASVSKILPEHRGPARHLSLHSFSPYDIPERSWERKVDGWLHSPALDGLQELNFACRFDMPLSVFRFAPTLRVARFDHCDFPESISALCLNFPSLKQLTFFGVTITEDALHSVLSGCTALESLELNLSSGIRTLCISSQTLRSLGLSARCIYGVISHLLIKDAPSLERLLPLNRYKRGLTTIRVIHAPKLEILVLLSKGLSKVQFGTTIFQKMIAVSLSTKMHSMKVLVIPSIGPNLDAVVDFLKCFPCLVKLYVISQPMNGMNNARKYDPLDPIECLELHLRKVVLMNYDGSKRPSVDFAKFFVLNAKLLKEMEIKVLNHRSDEWMADQHRQLRVEDRASRDARIELKIDTRKSFMHRVDSHDLSMADPFDNRSFY